jgi:hypothetical protein
MSIFLCYFEDTSLASLAGERGRISLVECGLRVGLGGETIASEGLSINYGWDSSYFRICFDEDLHPELFAFLAERLAAGKSPGLFFHWFHGNESEVDVESVAEVTIRDPAQLFEVLQATPNDRVLRLVPARG